MWVFHVTAIDWSQDLPQDGDVFGTAAEELRRDLGGLGFAGGRAGGHESRLSSGGGRGRRGQRVFASLYPGGIAGDGGDDAVHLLLAVVHVMTVLTETKENEQ